MNLRQDSEDTKSKLKSLKYKMQIYEKNQQLNEEILRKNRFASYINKKYK